jgi:hypothetical protein
MDNAELKAEADVLIRGCGLPELLAAYPGWFIGGSYSYDLMCWRDLDIYVFDPNRDLKCCFEIGYELTRRLGALKARFTNNSGRPLEGPDGLYWGIKLGDERQGAWKLDLWFLDQAGYEEHRAYSSRLRDLLTPKSRSIILAIKEAYWQRREYRDSITGDMIYRAVLDNGVTTVAGFERIVRGDVR